MTYGVFASIRAGDLDVAYLDVGPATGTPVILLHGFPYDVWAYDEVMSLLAEEGCRAIVPYCAATARPGSCRRRRCAADSRACWQPIWSR